MKLKLLRTCLLPGNLKLKASVRSVLLLSLLQIFSSGCVQKSHSLNRVSPDSIEVGQTIYLYLKEETEVGIFTSDGTDDVTEMKSKRLIVRVTDSDSVEISGVLGMVYDASSDTYVANRNEDLVVQVNRENVGSIRVWKSKTRAGNHGEWLELLRFWPLIL